MAKCAFHSENDAVEKCEVCGKGLCKECGPKFANEKSICPICSKESDKKELKTARGMLALISVCVLLACAVLGYIVYKIIDKYDTMETLKDKIVPFVLGAAVLICIALLVFFLVKFAQATKFFGSRVKLAENIEAKPVQAKEVKEVKETKVEEPVKKDLATTTAKTTKTVKKATPAKKEAKKEVAKKEAKTTTTVKANKPATTKEAPKTVAKAPAKKEAAKPAVKPVAKTTAKPAAKPVTAKKPAAKKPATKKATTKK